MCCVRLCGGRAVAWRGAVEAWQETRSGRLLGRDVELCHTIPIRVRRPFSKSPSTLNLQAVVSSPVSFALDIPLPLPLFFSPLFSQLSFLLTDVYRFVLQKVFFVPPGTTVWSRTGFRRAAPQSKGTYPPQHVGLGSHSCNLVTGCAVLRPCLGCLVSYILWKMIYLYICTSENVNYCKYNSVFCFLGFS